jgi:hypothetical protein
MSDFCANSIIPDVKVSGIINAPIGQIWSTVGEFNAFPSVLPSIWDTSHEFYEFEGEEGIFRELATNEGGNIIEKLEVIDCLGPERSIEFSILGGSFADILPINFETYEAKIQLERTRGEQTRFTWIASYEVKEGVTEEEARSVFEGIFNTALEGLRTIHEPQLVACGRPDINLPPLEYPDASISVVINAPIDAVWATVGNFNALPHYLPSLWDKSELDLSDADSSGVGAVRTLKSAVGTANESQIIEELLAYDGLGNVRSLKFNIVEEPVNFPLPFDISTYEAFMQVERVCGDRSRFTWSASYEPIIGPDEAAAALEGLFNVAADNLKLIHEEPDICTGAGGCGCALEACDDFGWEGLAATNCADMGSPLEVPTVCNQPVSTEDPCGLAPVALGADYGLEPSFELMCAGSAPLDISCIACGCHTPALVA